ncbi:hypothetical protein [Burkholderia gladioli]|uniref:hypothetical protein n=1 Tax=Burkholderia gladioli TaxID=28095 RepID=UPI0034DAF1AB
MLNAIRNWFEQRRRIDQFGKTHAPAALDVENVRVGDGIIAQVDVVFPRPKSENFIAWHACSGKNQFTAGRTYKVVQVRRRTKVAFVFDDQGFRIPVDRIIARHFVLASPPAQT